LTVGELKDILKSRGLKIGGVKSELVTRLEESISIPPFSSSSTLEEEAEVHTFFASHAKEEEERGREEGGLQEEGVVEEGVGWEGGREGELGVDRHLLTIKRRTRINLLSKVIHKI